MSCADLARGSRTTTHCGEPDAHDQTKCEASGQRALGLRCDPNRLRSRAQEDRVRPHRREGGLELLLLLDQIRVDGGASALEPGELELATHDPDRVPDRLRVESALLADVLLGVDRGEPRRLGRVCVADAKRHHVRGPVGVDRGLGQEPERPHARDVSCSDDVLRHAGEAGELRLRPDEPRPVEEVVVLEVRQHEALAAGEDVGGALVRRGLRRRQRRKRRAG